MAAFPEVVVTLIGNVADRNRTERGGNPVLWGAAQAGGRPGEEPSLEDGERSAHPVQDVHGEVLFKAAVPDLLL